MSTQQQTRATQTVDIYEVITLKDKYIIWAELKKPALSDRAFFEEWPVQGQSYGKKFWAKREKGRSVPKVGHAKIYYTIDDEITRFAQVTNK